MNEAVTKVMAYLGFRKQSYQQVFNLESRFAVEVLEDLSKFCRAHESTYHPDARTHAILEGRREVWLRIQQHLQLTPDELWKLFGKKGN